MDQDWTLMFAREYLRQAGGRGDLHDLIDFAPFVVLFGGSLVASSPKMTGP